MKASLIFNTCLTLVFILYHKISRMILFGFVFILYADVGIEQFLQHIEGYICNKLPIYAIRSRTV